jgi:type IV secretory pathway protease TraF
MLQTLAAGRVSLLHSIRFGIDRVSELSTEIKGERLRFVDAMKEATTLNVHRGYFAIPLYGRRLRRLAVHVEQFKSHLSREVHVMTQEVVRLQRERDLLEQRIGELRRVAR